MRELDLTNHYSIQVIATRSALESKFKFIPKADQRLDSGDVLVSIGHIEQMGKIQP